MVNKCTVTGYKSQKSKTKQDNSDNKEKLQFPDDKVRKDLWKSKIPHKNTENSPVCEKHFLPTDYVTERTDQQTRRIRRKGKALVY